MKKHCKTCKFMGSDDVHFICRKNPPKPFPQKGIQALWPCVDPEHDWCGSHPVMQKTKTAAKKPAAKKAKKK